MATTSLWEIYKRIDKVIEYTTNVEKTEKQNADNELYKSLHNTIEYVKADFKTEKQYFVTGINCGEKTALKEMILTKEKYGKTGGILAYHGFQSFAENEVTPEIAHEIGVKLAEELWGDKYEVIVSTHINTKHIHNHFVINSVSFADGTKYRNDRRTYALMRKTSDDICSEYNLSIVKEKSCGKLNINYTKYYNSYVQRNSYYTMTKDDVDFAIKQAYSYKNFENILKQMGYNVIIRANKISLCRPPYKRNIRIERAFGEEYSIANIEERIYNTQMPKIPFIEEYKKTKKYTGKNKTIIHKQRGSLYRLYMYYCYLLKVFPKNKNRTKMTQLMKQDILKLDKISCEIKFLCRNKINSTKELFLYHQEILCELQKQITKRNSLRRKRQKTTDTRERQDLCDEILIITDKIDLLKKEVRLCESVDERVHKMKSNIKNMEEQENLKGKEKNKSEFVRFSRRNS